MADENVSLTQAQLMTHEAVCAQRYEQINRQLENGSARMNKIEYWLYAVLAAVLLGPGAAAEFFKRLIGL